MNQRTTKGIVIVIILLGGIAGMRVADPFEQRERAPEFDFSESPDEIAATAMVQTESMSYAVEVQWNETTNETNGRDSRPSDLVQGTYRIRHDHGDEQVRGHYPNGDRVFANPYFTWTRDPNQTTTDRTTNPSGLPIGNSAAATVRSCGCVRVEADNEHTLVLVIDDTQTAIKAQYGSNAGKNVERNEEATLTLYIDKDSRQLQKAVFRWERTDVDNVRHVREGNSVYSNWGETEVKRPDWAGYSLKEFALDILNHERTS